MFNKMAILMLKFLPIVAFSSVISTIINRGFSVFVDIGKMVYLVIIGLIYRYYPNMKDVYESFSSKYDLVENQQYFDEENEAATDAKVYPMVAEPKEDDDYDLIDESLEYDEGKSKSIGKTVAAEDKFLNVDITIWVEGWQKFKVFDDEDDYSSIWDNSFIDSKFNVGFEFAINAEIDE